MRQLNLVIGKPYKTKKGERRRAWLKKDRVTVASKAGFKTVRDAKKWGMEKENLLLAQEHQPTILITFFDLANDYLTWTRARRRPNTYVCKRGVYIKFFDYLRNEHPLALAAGPQDIDASFIESYMDVETTRMSTKTANRARRELSAVFNHGIRRRGLLIHNPCHRIEKLPETEYVRPVPTDDVVSAYRAAALPGDESDFIETYCNTLQRGISIRRLAWMDIFLDRRVAGFRVRKRRSGNDELVWVHLNDTMMEILTRRFRERPQDARYVFTNPETGGRYRRRSVFFYELFKNIQSRIERRLSKEAGEPVKYIRITGHELRHWGSHCLDDLRISEEQIQNLLGHKDRKTTKVYLGKMRVDEQTTDALERLHNGRQKTGLKLIDKK